MKRVLLLFFGLLACSEIAIGQALPQGAFYYGSTKVGSYNSSGAWSFLSSLTTTGITAPAAATAFNITTGTTDGADSASLTIGAGGAISSTRGGLLQMFGNEYASFGGRVYLQAGDGSAASGANPAILFSQAAVNGGQITGDGSWTIGPGSFNGTHTVNGTIAVTNIGGNNLILKKSSGASMALWPDTTGASNITSIDNSSGTFRIYNNGGTPLFTGTQAGVLAFPFYANGSLSITGGVGTVSSSSDSRLKIPVDDDVPGVIALMALRPRFYRWKPETGYGDDMQLGFFAQEAGTAVPTSLGKPNKPGGYFGLYDRPIIATLVKAGQEQQATITQLQATIAALTARVDELTKDKKAKGASVTPIRKSKYAIAAPTPGLAMAVGQ